MENLGAGPWHILQCVVHLHIAAWSLAYSIKRSGIMWTF